MLEKLILLKEQMAGYGANYPWAIFLALIVLPGFGLPVSILLLIAGAVWGANISSGLVALAAVAINILWTHSIAAGPGRKLTIRFLGRRWQQWKDLPRNDLLRLAVMLRLTPGVPLFVQNYVLGLLRVPLWQSLLVALPITGFYVFGFVLTGGAIFEGRLGTAITGLMLVTVAALGVRWLSGRMVVKGAAATQSPTKNP